MGAPERQICRVLESRIRKIPIRTIRSSFWAGIRDLSLYPVDRHLQSPQNQVFFVSNCPQAARFIRSLAVFCLRWTMAAQDLQYFARLEPGRKGWPQTAHRFCSFWWSKAAAKGSFKGRTAAQNHLHSREWEILCTHTRPCKLHITRFPINSKAHLFRCLSSPHKV